MRRLILILAIALTVVAGLTTLRLRKERAAFEVLASQKSAALPRLWQVPAFSLTERSGQPLSLADLQGKIWVADFFYTTCPGPCPMLTSRLSEIHQALANDDHIRLVSISSDPQKDTPEVLRAYAQQFQASDRWYFLTGDKSAIYRLANEGFKVGLAEDPSAREPISHSTKLILVDRAGFVRGFYEGVGEGGGDTARLLTDIRRLEKENLAK